MKILSNVFFWFGSASIPSSILLWFFGTNLVESSSFSGITDVALRNALLFAHAERWSLFIGLWAPTLFTISRIFDAKSRS